MKFTQFVFCAETLLCAALTASAQSFDFNKDKVGGPPKGFSTAVTGQGKAGVWVVMKDDASPNQGNVLAQTDADATGYRFPLCVYDGLTAKDVDISVKFKPVSGKKDQAAGVSYRDLEEMIRERGLSLDHTTIYLWVQAYAPELEKRIRPHLRPTNDSYRVDETYVKIKGAWKYLYRAVDSTGQTIDFMLSAKRDARAAKRFFRKMLKAPSHSSPRVINVD